MGDNQILIPVNRPKNAKNTAHYLQECVKSGWFSSEGPFVTRFEHAFAHYLGAKYVTTVSSGTTALHLALLSLNLKPGDEVILPALTIASCYFAIWYCGAKAVPVDVDKDTYTMDPALIESRITKKTKVIMPVHLFGHPCDMDPIMKLAKKHKLQVLEDAAEAHGAEYKGKKVGGIGDVGIFSFYTNKIVTTGEGGMLVTNDKNIYENAVKLKNLYHSQTRFIHDGIGYNYRMTNMQAAVGLASLEEIEKSINYKRRMAEYYNNHLANTPGLILPQEMPWAKNVYWMYAVQVDPKTCRISRDTLMKHLATKGIQTRTFFYAPKTAFKKLSIYQRTRFPVTEQLEKTGFYLPSGLGNTLTENKIVINTVNAYLKRITYPQARLIIAKK